MLRAQRVSQYRSVHWSAHLLRNSIQLVIVCSTRTQAHAVRLSSIVCKLDMKELLISSKQRSLKDELANTACYNELSVITNAARKEEKVSRGKSSLLSSFLSVSRRHKYMLFYVYNTRAQTTRHLAVCVALHWGWTTGEECLCAVCCMLSLGVLIRDVMDSRAHYKYLSCSLLI